MDEGRVNGLIAISRAIGDWEYKRKDLKPEDNMVSSYPEVIVEPIKPEHDFLILACDGIWDCLSSQEAVNFSYDKLKLMKKNAAVGSSSPTKVGSGTVNGRKSNASGASPSKYGRGRAS